MKNSSIYEGIIKAREENSLLPYPFQDPQTAGREDTLFILLSEGIPYSRKEDFACECCRMIADLLEAEATAAHQKKADLMKFLAEHPLRLFFIEFRERLRVLIEHQTYDQTALHRFGMDLVRNSEHPEEVKMGIIILGFFPHDLTQQIFKILGYHSDFTIYVAESLRHSHYEQNQFIFDLAQHTDGYGKLAALFLLKPVTEEQKEWVIKEGTKSLFLANIYSSLAFQKTDIREHLFQVEITENNYSDLMYFLAYREPSEEEVLSEKMLAFMERMIEKKEYARSFIDQAGMVIIWHQVIENWKQDYQDLDGESDLEEEKEIDEYWNQRFQRYEELIRSIEIFLNQPKWNLIASQELGDPTESDYLIVTVLQFLEMKPPLADFSAALRRNPLGLNLLDFFLANHSSTYFSDICLYLEQLLNQELFLLPMEAGEEATQESDDFFRVHVWLETLFGLMIEKEFYDEKWLLKGIRYYQPEIRRLALQALNKNREKWEKEVWTQLQLLEREEKNRKNSLLLKRMLNPEAQNEKERRYLQILNPIVETSPSDRQLLDSYISGSHYYDLSVVEAILKKDSVLQLVRDRENEKDRFSVAITMENGYLLGYLPRADNRVLANLLDNQERLYAVLKSEDIEEPDPHIIIMLKHKESKPLLKKEVPGKNILQFPVNNRD